MKSMRRTHNFDLLQSQKTDIVVALNLWKMKGMRPLSLPSGLCVLLGSSNLQYISGTKWTLKKYKSNLRGEEKCQKGQGILSYPQPTSHAQWEIFLAGTALKTLCPGLDFQEEYSTCPCQSLAPGLHSYCHKVLICSTQQLESICWFIPANHRQF